MLDVILPGLAEILGAMYMLPLAVARMAMQPLGQIEQAITVSNPFTTNTWTVRLWNGGGIIDTIIDLGNLMGLELMNTPLIVLILAGIGMTWASVFVVKTIFAMFN